jgi:hypothetical protein
VDDNEVVFVEPEPGKRAVTGAAAAGAGAEPPNVVAWRILAGKS